MLCSELIGRDAEFRRVRARLDDLGSGTGGVLAVVAPAGLGKSRLLAAAVEGSTALVLSGRAVPADNPAPYRPLADAFLAPLREREVPVDPALTGFEAHLARVLPSWGPAPVGLESPVLVGEALLRLAGVLADGRPCVLVLEDLHWADPETLAVVDYVGDAARGSSVLCLGTARPDGPVADLLDRLGRRDPSDVVSLAPLSERAVGRMVGSCLAAADPPPGLVDFVTAHCDGSPFVVEEVLAGLAATGSLRSVDGSWETLGPLTPSVPATLRESIRRRLDRLDPVQRRVLGSASLLGRLFEWELLPGIAEVDGSTAAAALRAGVGAQLIEVDGDGFRFRHALTREAVLADLLPPERRELATRAWPAIELAHPGLPGPLCQLAADLAEAAGDRPAAATRSLEAARRAFAAGALVTAEAAARRARSLAESAEDIAEDADELLVQVLGAAGRPLPALDLGAELSARWAATGSPQGRRADLLVTMGRAALAAGDLDAAGDALVGARVAAGPGPEPELMARIEVVSAAVALDRGELGEASERAEAAVVAARATDQPAVECEALLVLGRVRRADDYEGAARYLEQAAGIAEDAALGPWHVRADLELGLEAFAREGVSRLEQTRAVAARYGDLHTVAVVDLILADAALSAFDAATCLRAATACADAGRRYHLASEAVAHLWVAGAHALRGDDDAMHQAIDAALSRDPDDPRILGDLYGRVLATRAFVRDELDGLPELLDRMMPHVRRAPPGTSVFPGRVLWVLMQAIDAADAGVEARAELAHDVEQRFPFFRPHHDLIEAVAAGRAGRGDEAAGRADGAFAALLAAPTARGATHATALVAARAAIRDGWGDPAGWLRRSEAFFAAHGFDRLVRRSRSLLADAGAPVPRPGRGTTEIPTSLRALGVTSREVDVLRLVVDGRTTKEIAAALYLSPKTVERHLGSLFDRTGVRNRRALAELGVGLLDRDP